MKQERTHYSTEFKIKAVELSNQRGSLQEIANELGIGRESLRNWRKLSKAGKLGLSNASTPKVRSKEEEENIRLRKELYEVKLERDILKKAVSIFSKNDR